MKLHVCLLFSLCYLLSRTSAQAPESDTGVPEGGILPSATPEPDPSPCPDLSDCLIICAFGRVVDENGCEICECQSQPDDDDEIADETTGDTTGTEDTTGTSEDETTGDTTGTEDTTGTSEDETTGDTTGTVDTTGTEGIGEDSTAQEDETTADTTDTQDTTGTGSEESTSGNDTSVSASARRRCPLTVGDLIAEGCPIGCIVRGARRCPQCNRTCAAIANGAFGNQCNNTGDCEENQICLAVGSVGRRICIDLLVEGDRCGPGAFDDDDEDEDSTTGDEDSEESSSSSSEDFEESSLSGRGRARARGRIVGASDRIAVGQLRPAEIPCGEGLVCARVGLDRRMCIPENENGTCVQARQDNPELVCSQRAMGDFDPTQCTRQDDGSYNCFCVQPEDGTMLPDTVINVSDPDDAPAVCDGLVYDRCELEVGDLRYSVSHGEYFLNIQSCSRCLCDDGEAVFCESAGNCDLLTGERGPQSCQVEGRVIEHGETFEVDCNTCGCRNGRITCTHRRCDRDDDDEEGDEDDDCDRCRSGPRRAVCATDGRTYLSECYAVSCAGQSAADLLPGPCAAFDVCELYPCEEGQICLRRGGVYCFDPDGCAPDDLRQCVNPDDLVCEDEGDDTPADPTDLPIEVEENPEAAGGPEGEGPIADDDEEDLSVCGTNGVTYPSICRLLQDTGNVEVAYAGDCDAEDCSGGPVCGTDGVTYENICVLRSRSSHARVDYYGECDPDTEEPIDDLCIRVSRARRCAFNESNCRRRVRPEEGCCALCGGIVYVAIDFRGLGEFVTINPLLRTLDALVRVLVESGFISEEVTDRCLLEPSFTDSGDLEISLSARDPDTDADFCFEQSEILAGQLNDPSQVPNAPPEILQFASAATSAPAIIVDDNTGGTPDGSTDGAPELAASYFSLLIICICTFIFQ